jgi:HAD superfamily hydrolase (TIGR01450 family)
VISPRFPYRGFLFDLDGTVYLGERLVPGAREAIAALRAEARRVCFLSNKPIQSRADYAAKLTRLGVPAALDDVINSSYVLAQYLAREAPGARCFVIGEPPLVEELRAAGLAPVDDARVDYVVVAFDRTFDYRKLDVALQAVKRHGARLVGTNPDRTCPVEGGEIPDAAGMIGAVEGVTGRRVDPVVGKPSPIMLRVALDRLGLLAADCAVVGDRLETDIEMGRAAGLGTILVLTGITRAGDPEIARWRPDHVVGSLDELRDGVAASGSAAR